MKHINVKYHFVRHMIEDNKVSLEKVDTLKNVANRLTKFVTVEKFSSCKESIGIAIAPSNLFYVCLGPLSKVFNKWNNVGYVLYSFHARRLYILTCFGRIQGLSLECFERFLVYCNVIPLNSLRLNDVVKYLYIVVCTILLIQ
jgi:hypothetical protein